VCLCSTDGDPLGVGASPRRAPRPARRVEARRRVKPAGDPRLALAALRRSRPPAARGVRPRAGAAPAGAARSSVLCRRESARDGMTAKPDAWAVFSESMVQLTRHLAGAIAAAYDFSGIRTIVDVGGGYGALLPPILKANPEMRGTVADLPLCRDGALRLFEK